jgi:Ca2+/Na+ antiporter
MLTTLLSVCTILFSLQGLLLTFYTIMLVCDNHLVPTVEVFIKQFEVPETVAAVTLVAFGSATPELLLNSIAAIEKTSDISMSAILGK